MRWVIQSKSPLRLVQLKTLQKNGKWLILRGTQPKKSGGHARFFFFFLKKVLRVEQIKFS